MDDASLKAALQTADRWNRIVANDVENILVGVLVMWATLLSAYDSFVHVVLMLAFTVSRCSHTVCFAYGLQPHRSLCWLLAVLAVLGMLGNGLYGIFSMIPLGIGAAQA